MIIKFITLQGIYQTSYRSKIIPITFPTFSDIDADGERFQANPGETVSLDVMVTNVGNLVDDLTLLTSVITSLQSGDSSTEWISSGSAISNLGVNETGNVSRYYHSS